MKKLRSILVMFILSMILMCMSSCVVRHYDNEGRHHGWFHHRDNYRDHRERSHGAVIIVNPHNHRSSNHD